MKLSDKLDKSFMHIPLSDSGYDASSRLTGGSRYGLIIDHLFRPVTIVKYEDLQILPPETILTRVIGQLPPGIVASLDDSMLNLVNSPQFAAFGFGARGVIVYNGEQIAGIVTDETIILYLQSEYEPASKTRDWGSDSRLAGKTITKPLIIYCEEFNHRNELLYFNRHNPQECQSTEPHPHSIRSIK